MKIRIICFSDEGAALAKRAASFYGKMGRETVCCMSRGGEICPLDGGGRQRKKMNLISWTGQEFQEADLLIFIGACGIAVRAIAPWIAGKDRDPAVLVMDDGGRFVISLLSGHMGGANELAHELAQELTAQPVITTATDRRGIWAVDTWAKKNGCVITDWTLAKEVSAALLRGEVVGFYSPFFVEGSLPEGMTFVNGGKEVLPLGVAVSPYMEKGPFAKTLFVVPRVVTVGVGCRKGTKKETLAAAVDACLAGHAYWPEAVRGVASIDLKKEETGIVMLCRERGWDFVTFGKEKLNSLSGTFSQSPFVRSVTDVDCVCERAALCAARGGTLTGGKTVYHGVTTAIAQDAWTVRFP